MSQSVYTHAVWRVRPGEEELFIAAWDALAQVFSQLDDRPVWGTLLRSTGEPELFYSFGPWLQLEHAVAMRNDPAAQAAISRVRRHCLEATPEVCELIRHVITDRTPDPAA